jgi:4,5-dihydroxyphthalate decarboxylase
MRADAAITNGVEGDMIHLRTLMGNHPQVMPIKRGEAQSSVLKLDFADEPVPHEAFKPFVRDLRFDCGELAIVTYLQALAYGKPLALLPVVVSSRFHQGSIGYNAARGAMKPKDLEGARVGVRTYSQTTGVWVRGILENDYDVDMSRVGWVTFDDSHLAEFHDPANCERAAKGKELDRMLFDGEIAAAIPISLASPLLSDPRIARLIPDHEQAARAWYAQHQALPINHMLVVRRSLVDEKPDVVHELYRLFVKSKKLSAAGGREGLDMTPVGVEATRKGLELIIDYSVQQGLIPRRLSVDEAYAGVLTILGDEA